MYLSGFLGSFDVVFSILELSFLLKSSGRLFISPVSIYKSSFILNLFLIFSVKSKLPS